MKSRKMGYCVNIVYLSLLFIPASIFLLDFFNLQEFIYNLKIENFSTFALMNSFKQGIVATLFSFLIGIIPGYYISCQKSFLSKYIDKLYFIPFVFPVISAVLSFSIIYNLPIFEKLGLKYTFFNIIVANVFYNSPIFVKYIGEGLRKIPKEIDEELSLIGTREIDKLFKVKFFMILPQILRASLLVFIYSFTSFVLVIALGGIEYSTLEGEIASTLTGGFDFSKVIALGFVQGIILLLINYLSTKAEGYELKGEGYEKKIGSLPKVYTALYAFLLTSVVLVSLIFSFLNIFTGEFQVSHYFTIFSKEFNENFKVIEGLRNSIIITGIGAFIITIIAYLMGKSKSKGTEIIVFLSYSLSSGILAIFLIYTNIRYNLPLSLLLIVGYILIGTPIAYSFMYQYIKKFDSEVLEAASLETKSKWEIFKYIEFPMLRKIFVFSYLNTFALLFGEFTISYTMQIGDTFPTISLVNYSLITGKKFLESSALSTVIIVFLFIIFTISQKMLED